MESELTVADILAEANEEEPTEAKYHSILEIWREVLQVARSEATKRITPQWATRICATYQGITYADMPEFRDLYFKKVFELLDKLEEEIASDDECLNVADPEEDTAHNSQHYLNLLINWQKSFLLWELAWDPTMPEAATELAGISEIHRMMFNETGLSSLLDNINFQLTDDHRELLTAALVELKDTYGEVGE